METNRRLPARVVFGANVLYHWKSWQHWTARHWWRRQVSVHRRPRFARIDNLDGRAYRIQLPMLHRTSASALANASCRPLPLRLSHTMRAFQSGPKTTSWNWTRTSQNMFCTQEQRRILQQDLLWMAVLLTERHPPKCSASGSGKIPAAGMSILGR